MSSSEPNKKISSIANLPAKVDEATKKASELYGENTALRVMVVAIPYIGGGLDMVFASEGQRAFKERVFKLLEIVRERMETVEEEAVDKKYLESEEFVDLVLKAFEFSTKTRDKEKIRWYAQILTESTMRNKQEGYSPEEYMYLISDLSPQELRVARSLYRERPKDNTWESWTEQVCNEVGTDKADLQLALSRIRSSGLIEEEIAGVDEGGLYIHTREPKEVLYYRVASPFEKLMKFLESDSSSIGSGDET